MKAVAKIAIGTLFFAQMTQGLADTMELNQRITAIAITTKKEASSRLASQAYIIPPSVTSSSIASQNHTSTIDLNWVCSDNGVIIPYCDITFSLLGVDDSGGHHHPSHPLAACRT